MICAGNWKLNKNPSEAENFVAELLSQAKENELSQLVLLPPSVCLDRVIQKLAGKKVGVGAQNCHWQLNGAYTGENSAETISQMGGQFCLVGHSERRFLFGETNEMIAKKILTVQKQGLTPIFCIGESVDEREGSLTIKVLTDQLKNGLSEVDEKCPIWIAYEPVWAIGTGRVATKEQVRDTHKFIRGWLEKNRPAIAKVPILYGGSVKPENAQELVGPNVDGFLIGGASLKVDSFLGILRAATVTK